jgi:PhoH-like ATPase
VSRAIFPLGRDIGYLPGSLEDKMEPWLQPIYDNLDFLLGQREQRQTHRQRPRAEDLVDMGLIEVVPITYIRGRSIPNQFLIVDEAQNLTPHEMKTMLTRAGQGTKVVLLGDPHQVDHPYLDAERNGLIHVSRRFIDQACAVHIHLSQGERSPLAELAADLL